MQRKSAIFRDRPQNPIETALFWIDFALRHNDTIGTLGTANAHLNTFQIRLIDVYLFDFIILLLILILVKHMIIIVNRGVIAIFFGKTDEILKKKKTVKND